MLRSQRGLAILGVLMASVLDRITDSLVTFTVLFVLSTLAVLAYLYRSESFESR